MARPEGAICIYILLFLLVLFLIKYDIPQYTPFLSRVKRYRRKLSAKHDG